MYKIIWSETAAGQLEKLDKKAAMVIVKKLESAQKDPLHYLTKLKHMPFHKLRVGDYRVIVQLENNKMVIFVVEVGHRKNIYKK